MARRLLSWLLAGLVALLVASLVLLELRTRQGQREADEQFAASVLPRIGDFGSTRTLTIVPLVDWHAARPELRTELGLAYLVETDDHRVLFDVAHNARSESPSPLEQNMRALGVGLDSIDTIFISHNHLDHVGGFRWQRARSFSIGLEQAPLPNPATRVFVPIAMSYPGSVPIRAEAPVQIAEGVASTGTVPRQLVLGWIDEHSLVVHVAGRGDVLVVGCGHQPVANLLRRYDQVFDGPLYGILGGLHLPVPEGRMRLLGLDTQRRLASGGGLFDPLTMDDVREVVELLKARGLGVVGVGGHDSSDEVIAMFAEAFGEDYRYVRVGKPIVIGLDGVDRVPESSR